MDLETFIVQNYLWLKYWVLKVMIIHATILFFLNLLIFFWGGREERFSFIGGLGKTVYWSKTTGLRQIIG